LPINISEHLVDSISPFFQKNLCPTSWMLNILEKFKSEPLLKLSKLFLIPVHLIFGFLLTHVGLLLAGFTKLINQVHHLLTKKMELNSILLTELVVSVEFYLKMLSL
jgi:hypothetical protein